MAYTNIDKSSDYFETVTYSGNGTGQDITTLDFQPDWLWIKRRNAVGSHRIQDSIRGTANYLQSDKTDAEASGGDVDAFLSNGFSLSGGATAYNVSGGTYVGWSWLAGGTASSNSNGSITSTVSVNQTAGFSVVSWTGNSGTIGHGLGVKPAMIIVKSRQTANNWVVIHKGLTGGMDTNVLILNGTDAESSGGSGMAEPTSSVFTITSGLASNDNQIGYVFAEKKGYSKFGSYTGNANADGSYIHLGFRPAWLLIKRSSATQSWILYDNKRSSFNTTNDLLFANTSGVESADNSVGIDFLSNGFKCRSADDSINSGTYIYMAFAESPFVNSNGVPNNAR